jgi:outer membrane immunogenic protein
MGAGLALALATTAASADGYPRGSIKDPVPCCDTWQGFYLGIHGGYGWKENDFAEFVGTNFPSLSQVYVGGIDSKGWLFGAQAGYNWQYGALVGGLELDISSTSIDGTSAPAGVTQQGVVETHTRADDVQWLGSARARLGFAPQRGSGCCGGNVLLYATGGLAWERFERTNSNVTTINPPGFTITSGSVVPNDRFGWVAGLGAEAKVGGSNWVGRIEYLHYEFGTSETVNFQTITGAAGTNFRERADNQTIEVIRAGLSYKF